MPAEQNCIDIFLGPERARSLQENRTAIMTPGWIEMITTSIAEGFWTMEDARINLGWYDKILLLDTGIEPLTDEMILEFFELTRVPIEILPVRLDRLRSKVRPGWSRSASKSKTSVWLKAIMTSIAGSTASER